MVIALVFATATAVASSEVKVPRCGYTTVRYWGKVGVYPWHVSCAAAKRVLIASEARHVRTKVFTAVGAVTDDGGAVLIDGKWWVCGGRMGSYFCGYPYRPAVYRGSGGGTTFKGPFTKDIAFNACSNGPRLCGSRDTVWLP